VVFLRTLTGRPTFNPSPPDITMHLPFVLSPRQIPEQNYESSLFPRAVKRVRSNADSHSSSEPREALRIRASDQTLSTGNSTVYIIIVCHSNVQYGIPY
jgi:hypothetical protein